LGDGGLAIDSQLFLPHGVVSDSSNNIYIADTADCVIREVLASNRHIYLSVGSTTKGCGLSGDGSSAVGAQLNNPVAVAISSSGILYIADTSNYRVREVQ
jgi:hypothetical protein